jgi:hypothetical protein
VTRRSRSVVGVTAVVAMVVLAVLAVVVDAVTSTGAAPTAYLWGCAPVATSGHSSTNGVRSPSSVSLSCADDNVSLAQLTWSDWGDATSTATGYLVWNPCHPSCVADALKTQFVEARVSHLVRHYYTRLTITPAPPGVSATYAFYPSGQL